MLARQVHDAFINQELFLNKAAMRKIFSFKFSLKKLCSSKYFYEMQQPKNISSICFCLEDSSSSTLFRRQNEKVLVGIIEKGLDREGYGCGENPPVELDCQFVGRFLI